VKIWKLATLAAAALVASVTTASAQELGGKYRVSGTNLNGSRYAGTTEIVFTSATTCRIVWGDRCDDVQGHLHAPQQRPVGGLFAE
jgi:hypothetical protein